MLITDFRAPLTLEWAPGHNLSFIMDTRVVLREFWMVGSFPGGPGQFNRLEHFSVVEFGSNGTRNGFV